MIDLYRKALDAAGYQHDEATSENVRSCFLDYVAAGYWSNLTMDDDDLTDITVFEMCIALIGKRKR